MIFPKYVSIGGKCCCKLVHAPKNKPAQYYRDAGCWDMNVRWKDGKLQYKILGGGQTRYEFEVEECTVEEWKESNRGYI